MTDNQPSLPKSHPPQVFAWIDLKSQLDTDLLVTALQGFRGITAIETNRLRRVAIPPATRSLFVFEEHADCPLEPLSDRHPEARLAGIVLRDVSASPLLCPQCVPIDRKHRLSAVYQIIDELLRDRLHYEEVERSPADLDFLQIDRIGLLSKRQLEVFRQLGAGVSKEQCATQLSLSLATVENHKYAIMKKLQLHRSHQLVLLGARLGWLQQGLFRPDPRDAAIDGDARQPLT